MMGEYKSNKFRGLAFPSKCPILVGFVSHYVSNVHSKWQVDIIMCC